MAQVNIVVNKAMPKSEAIAILQKRLANGEISSDEYLKTLKVLQK